MPKSTDALLLGAGLEFAHLQRHRPFRHTLWGKRDVSNLRNWEGLAFHSAESPRHPLQRLQGLPLGSPAYLPELSSPCLVIYVCVLIFSTSLRTGWDLHISELLILQRERKGWGSKSSSAGNMEGGSFSWPWTSCVALCSVQKFETADSWEDCGPSHSPTLWVFSFPIQVEWSWVGHGFCSKYRNINLGSI